MSLRKRVSTRAVDVEFVVETSQFRNGECRGLGHLLHVISGSMTSEIRHFRNSRETVCRSR